MGEELRDRVKRRYAGAALTVLEGTGTASCCGSAGERGLDSEAVGVDWTGGGYSAEELKTLPQAAGAASLGCGNPTALATLSPGEVVLDLGSGGGIDVLLSAKRVSPDGKAYGLDMTDEMLALAEKNKAEAGAENAAFLKGHIEEIPLPDDHVDVVISNCVINLSTDKPRVIS
jgi:arsenite methyltransferase